MQKQLNRQILNANILVSIEEPTPKSRLIFQIKESIVKKYSFYSLYKRKTAKKRLF